MSSAASAWLGAPGGQDQGAKQEAELHFLLYTAGGHTEDEKG